MPRLTATLPGYASVARASDVLHLAKRSVRDLIYAGRLPTLRIGRLHFIKSDDLERERRRRLGLALPKAATRRASTHRSRPERPPAPPADRLRADPAARRQRAAERAELVRNWVQRHAPVQPRVPAVVLAVTSPISCEVCEREIRRGRIVELSQDPTQQPSRLCLACGRRALLEWADRRRAEAVAARRLAESFGQPEPGTSTSRVA